MRAIGTAEAVKVTALRNQVEWLTGLPQRRREFADRPVYLSILATLHAQGTAESRPRPTNYPRALIGLFQSGQRPEPMTPSRLRMIGVVLLAPAVLAAGVALGLEGGRLGAAAIAAVRASGNLHAGHAIAHHDAASAYRLIREGQRPDDVIVVNHPTLTAGRQRFVSPLWWAVAMRDEHTMLMLLGVGATILHVEGRDADCLAEALGAAAMQELLRRYGAPPEGPCPKQTAVTRQ